MSSMPMPPPRPAGNYNDEESLIERTIRALGNTGPAESDASEFAGLLEEWLASRGIVTPGRYRDIIKRHIGHDPFVDEPKGRP